MRPQTLGPQAKVESAFVSFAREAFRLSLVLLGMAGMLSGLNPNFSDETASVSEILQQVQQLIQRGDLAAARQQLKLARSASPSDPNVFNLMGVVEAHDGQYEAAEADFQKALVQAPRFMGAYLNLGRLYQENAGKDPRAMKKAVATYEKLLQFDPGNVEARYQSALLLALMGSFRPSLEHLARLPAEAQEKPQALAVRSVDYAVLKDSSQANAAAERLLRHPDLAEADISALLPVLTAQHQVDFATRLLEGLANRQLATTETLHQLAGLYWEQGRLTEARATLEKVAQEKPITTPLLLELARIAYQQKDYDGTFGYLAHARDLEPNNSAIHFFWGIVAVEKNLAEEAYRAFKKAVMLDPDNAYYNYAMGGVAMLRQDAREAIPYLQKYRQLKPDDPRGGLALGAAYFNAHDDVPAENELQAVAQRRETAAAAHYYLGRIANQHGEFGRAMAELQQALHLDPRYADAYAEKGLIHMKQKQYAEAEASLRKALELNPDSYLANLNLMILYQRSKDSRAQEQAQKFQEVKTQHDERAKEFLRTVQVRP